jgi:hypothetical protein
MSRITLAVAVCTILSACATGAAPRKPEPIPPELIPDGYTADDCHITDPGGPMTETGPDGIPRTVGTRPPKVACSQHVHIPGSETTTCHTPGGKPLDLQDCCLNPDGSSIPNCTKKLFPPGE